MKQSWCITLFFLVAAGAVAGPPVTTTNLWLRSFELNDQSNQPLRLVFPRTNLLVLTVADHQGSRQVEGWVRPLKARFPEGLAIEGVADVSSVPAVLRPLVRREFKQKFTYPVLLDWAGKFVRPLNCARDAVNVFAVAKTGEVLARFSGPMDTNRFAELVAVLEQAGRPAGTAATGREEKSAASAAGPLARGER